jgi:hypothetical protein
VYDIKMIRLGGKGYRASRRLDRRIEGREWLKISILRVWCDRAMPVQWKGRRR